MESMQKWNTIVDLFNKNKKIKENDIQKLWENIFIEFFGYGRYSGSLDAQKSFSIGSHGILRPDIILKRGEKQVCAVELKQETITLNERIENQLFSYLKQTKINIGVIIADKIYLYAYNYFEEDSRQAKIEISFEENNIEGEKFVNLLSFDAFSSDSINKFVTEKINHLNNVRQIKENLSKKFVLDAIGYYLEKQYSQEEIKEALASININVCDKKKQQVVNNSTTIESKSPIKTDLQNRWNLDSNVLIKGGKMASNYLKKYLLDIKYIDENSRVTLAKINKDTKKINKRYWANPPIDYLNYDWFLILNDNINCKLLIFKIPAKSISQEKVKTRIYKGKTLIDLEIVNQNNEFICLSSKLKFNKWFVETITYGIAME